MLRTTASEKPATIYDAALLGGVSSTQISAFRTDTAVPHLDGKIFHLQAKDNYSETKIVHLDAAIPHK